nr:NADH dehydrogenase subunit 6 [Nigrobaetis niger]
MLNLALIMLLLLSLVFMVLTHPISMGLMLILQTLLIGLITGLTNNYFWFSYILFLVFLGGVLVLFVYMTSLASNEKFEFNWLGAGFMSLGLSLAAVFFIMVLAPSNSLDLNLSYDMFSYFGFKQELPMMKLYSSYSCVLTLFLIVYLLFVLLVCVQIVGGSKGALRNFN